VDIVTFHSRLIFLPGFKDTLKLWLQLAYFLFSSFTYQSELSREYVRIIRSCLLVHGYLLTSSHPFVYLCHPHRTDTLFLAAYLRERGYYVNLVATPYTPLAVHNKYLIADSIKLCDPYQASEFEAYNKLGTCHHFELWPVARIYELVNYYKNRKIEDHTNILGLYTQGFWLRIQTGKSSEVTGQRIAKQEHELIENLLEYLTNHPAVKLIIFPHPMERRHFEATGEHQFKHLQSISQVEVDFTRSSSVYDFDRVGVGITTVSSSGFERIHLGFRTLFYIPYVSFMDLSVNSSYNTLFTKNKEELFGKIDQIREMRNEDFIKHYFGDSFMSISNTLLKATNDIDL
jgi:hypothetical protein